MELYSRKGGGLGLGAASLEGLVGLSEGVSVRLSANDTECPGDSELFTPPLEPDKLAVLAALTVWAALPPDCERKENSHKFVTLESGSFLAAERAIAQESLPAVNFYRCDSPSSSQLSWPRSRVTLGRPAARMPTCQRWVQTSQAWKQQPLWK